MRKILYIVLLSVILIIARPSQARAQANGTFSCGVSNGSCTVTRDNCAVGYLPISTYCGSFSANECSQSATLECGRANTNQNQTNQQSTNSVCKVTENDVGCGGSSGSVTCRNDTRACVDTASGQLSCRPDSSCTNQSTTQTSNQNQTTTESADCYESNVQPGYNACISAFGHNSCGRGADGLDVCCNPDIVVCPPDTVKGKTQDPHQVVGTVRTGITCGEGGGGVNTAIGCIPINDQNALIGFFLRWGLGIGGGIAFLLILVAGFQIITSRGDPNRLKAGQELMTSAIAGLLLLIFSLVILRIIGFDILRIGAFQ